MYKCKTREINKINILSWCTEHEKCSAHWATWQLCQCAKACSKGKKSPESKTATERKVSALYDCNVVQNSTKTWFLEFRLVSDAKTSHE